MKSFTKVLLKIPTDKVVYIARGVAHQDMGNHDLAIKDFNKSLEIDPGLSDGYFRRGYSKLYSKLFQEAILDFQQAYKFQTEATKNFGILDGLACCYHALGHLDKAL